MSYLSDSIWTKLILSTITNRGKTALYPVIFYIAMFQAYAKAFTCVYSLIKSFCALLQVKNNQADDDDDANFCIFSSKSVLDELQRPRL